MNEAIQVKHLNVSYNGNQALQDVSFSFDKGKLIGIVGPNGAGKSTLMKAILGLVPKDGGHISMNQQTIKEVQTSIAYVPQRNHIDWDFPILVKDTVLLGTYPHLGLFKRPGKKEKKLAVECLEKVGMQDFKNRQISELSGGQQQRVFLARALAQQADFFFLDEPFVGIDAGSEEVIMKILSDLKAEGKTIFVVHHDLSKIESYFDDVIMVNKKLYGAGPVQQVFHSDAVKQCFHIQSPAAEGLGVSI
ncbi:MAG TPA: metal ABC transporter ATP-binding protein [Pseudogracilibacillus sp.]|nr:metal ABC transporter ATP-binding protein [Pseudogracilibacillus sp.]